MACASRNVGERRRPRDEGHLRARLVTPTRCARHVRPRLKQFVYVGGNRPRDTIGNVVTRKCFENHCVSAIDCCVRRLACATGAQNVPQARVAHEFPEHSRRRSTDMEGAMMRHARSMVNAGVTLGAICFVGCGEMETDVADSTAALRRHHGSVTGPVSFGTIDLTAINAGACTGPTTGPAVDADQQARVGRQADRLRRHAGRAARPGQGGRDG